MEIPQVHQKLSGDLEPRHCERSEAIQRLCLVLQRFDSRQGSGAGLLRRYGPVRRHSRRPFERVRRMRRKQPGFTLAMTNQGVAI